MQNMGLKGDISKSGNMKGLCLACSSDGFMVMVGCSDSAVRTFYQDTAGFRRAVLVSIPILFP